MKDKTKNNGGPVTCEICGYTYGVGMKTPVRPADLDGSSSLAAYLTGWTRTASGGWNCGMASNHMEAQE